MRETRGASRENGGGKEKKEEFAIGVLLAVTVMFTSKSV